MHTGIFLRPFMGALAAALLAGCAGSANTSTLKHSSNAQSAAVYNTELGIAYLNQGELALAKDKLDRAVTQDPSYADAHSARAMLFQRLGNNDKADAEFRTALRLAKSDPNVVNNYAVYLCQNGRTDEGVKRFEEAAKNPLYRTPEAAYTNAGVCLRAAKKDDAARVQFIKALQVKPNFADAALQLADMSFQHTDYTQARQVIDGYLANFAENPDLLLLGVRVARAQKDPVAAQRYARQLQVDFPGSDQTRALAALDRNPG
ncbi:MAG: type IV pilus biogenesis/stability protein PilW [Proteobacteria bacterium]|nr:type IV pilus biogenesis/stability protein PilW [Pseudomonadota bacterium]